MIWVTPNPKFVSLCFLFFCFFWRGGGGGGGESSSQYYQVSNPSVLKNTVPVKILQGRDEFWMFCITRVALV